MHITIPKQSLQRILSRAVAATDAKSATTILRHVLLRAEGDSLSASGTNLVMTVTASAPAKLRAPGAIAVPAKVADQVHELATGDVVLSLSKDGSRLNMKQGKFTRTMPILPGSEFPDLPGPDSHSQIAEMSSSALATLLGQTSYAQMPEGDSRSFAVCVSLEVGDGSARCVATDSKRLAMANCAYDGPTRLKESIPRRAVADIAKSCADHDDAPVAISVTGGRDGYIHFVWPGTTLTVKRTGQDFLNYQAFVGKTKHIAVQVPRAELAAAMKRVSAAAEDVTDPLDLTLSEGKLRMRAASDEGEATDEIDVSYAGADWSSSVNPKLFLEALKHQVDDDVILKAGAPLDPIVIVGAKDENAVLGLIMPNARGAT